MSIIYEPKGRAFEYAPLAANLYRGCEHGCVYCFGPDATFTDAKAFHAAAVPRKNVLEQLRKEAPSYAGDDREILLCFTCDPYGPQEPLNKITHQAIEIFRDNDIKYTILTKGGMRAIVDFGILKESKARFGTTLCFMDDDKRRLWEPNAAPIGDRITAIIKAKSMGIPTWASLEPVIDTEEALKVVGYLHPYIDFWKVGKLNHHEHEKTIDWHKFLIDVTLVLEKHNCKYYIKKDLAAYGTNSQPSVARGGE